MQLIYLCIYFSGLFFFFFFSFNYFFLCEWYYLITLSYYFWVEDKLEALRETSKKPEVEDPKPEPTTERLYLCSYVGCGKIFVDFRALDKHVQTHEERKHVCHYEGCEKVMYAILLYALTLLPKKAIWLIFW